jgi:nucleoside-diphosphate-sugar epimerase
MSDLYNTVTGKKSDDFLIGPGNAWVDVRDLAKAHVLAAQREEAGGERIVVAGGKYPAANYE